MAHCRIYCSTVSGAGQAVDPAAARSSRPLEVRHHVGAGSSQAGRVCGSPARGISDGLPTSRALGAPARIVAKRCYWKRGNDAHRAAGIRGRCFADCLLEHRELTPGEVLREAARNCCAAGARGRSLEADPADAYRKCRAFALRRVPWSPAELLADQCVVASGPFEPSQNRRGDGEPESAFVCPWSLASHRFVVRSCACDPALRSTVDGRSEAGNSRRGYWVAPASLSRRAGGLRICVVAGTPRGRWTVAAQLLECA